MKKNILVVAFGLLLCFSIRAMEEIPPILPELPQDIVNCIALILPRADDASQLQNLLTPFAQTNKTNLDLARKIYLIKKAWIIPKLPVDIENYLAQILPWQGVEKFQELLKPFSQTNNYNHNLAKRLYYIKKTAIEKIIKDMKNSYGFSKLDLMHNDLNVIDNSDQSFLHYAASENKPDIIRLLIAHGAHVNLCTVYSTPLMNAAAYNRCEAIKILLDCGADINQKRPDGLTALHIAARTNSRDALVLLLACEAQINATNNNQTTALTHAIAQVKYNVAQFLITHGADVNIKTSYGMSALAFAVQNKRNERDKEKVKEHQEIIDLLIAHGARE